MTGMPFEEMIGKLYYKVFPKMENHSRYASRNRNLWERRKLRRKFSCLI